MSVDRPSPVFVTNPPFSQYLAPLGAKYLEKGPKKYQKIDGFLIFFELVTTLKRPSAASRDYVKFQAVIKSAASAASQIQGTQVQGGARAPIRRPAAPVVSPSPVVRRSPASPKVLGWSWMTF